MGVEMCRFCFELVPEYFC